MLTESEALQRILSAVRPLPTERLPLETARNHFAAKPVSAVLPLPGFDNSAMDGYAVRSADTKTKSPLRVIGEQPAGVSRQLQVSAGEAIRIFTGAPLPQGADAVIMQEDVTRTGDVFIVCNEPVEPEENVRRTGCDLCAGQLILEHGRRLGALQLAMLAAQGMTDVEAGGTPRVAVVTTGDELAQPGETLQPGQVFNSNGVMLHALLRDLGVADITMRHVPDDCERTAGILSTVIAAHDFVILCGGVSVGDHDYVRPALQSLGAKPDFWRVKIKPGKPLLFSQTSNSDGGTCTVFGLPGNPVSGFVTFQLFVRPALLRAMGADETQLGLPQITAESSATLKNAGDRPHYVRGHFADGKFHPVGGQRSHELYGLSRSNALLRMEPGSVIEAGERVSVLLF